MTGCGETSELAAAGIHGLVAVLYAIMLAWRFKSIFIHLGREE